MVLAAQKADEEAMLKDMQGFVDFVEAEEEKEKTNPQRLEGEDEKYKNHAPDCWITKDGCCTCRPMTEGESELAAKLEKFFEEEDKKESHKKDKK